MNKLDDKRRAQVIAALVEGNSIRSIVRMTSVAKNTIVKLLIDIGAACSTYQDKALRNLICKRIQCDGIWSFVYAKEKNLPDQLHDEFGYGDVWTWAAFDVDTKLAVSWMVGGRDADHAKIFITDVASRLANHIQLTTEGYKVYLDAVSESLGGAVDYAMLIKLYGVDSLGEKRYGQLQCIGIEQRSIIGDPEVKHGPTSYIERHNLAMRTNMLSFARLTNGFSKKVENHAAAISLHFMYYNYASPHKTLSRPYPTTPAMAAGIAEAVWTIEDIVKLLDSN